MYKIIFLFIFNCINVFAINYPQYPLELTNVLVEPKDQIFSQVTNIEVKFFSRLKRNAEYKPDILSPTGKSKKITLNSSNPISNIEIKVFNPENYEILSIIDKSIEKYAASFVLNLNKEKLKEYKKIFAKKDNNMGCNYLSLEFYEIKKDKKDKKDKKVNVNIELFITIYYASYKPVEIFYNIELMNHKFDSSATGKEMRERLPKSINYSIKLSPLLSYAVYFLPELQNLRLSRNKAKLKVNANDDELEKMYQEQTRLIQQTMIEAEQEGCPFVETNIPDEESVYMDESL